MFRWGGLSRGLDEVEEGGLGGAVVLARGVRGFPTSWGDERTRWVVEDGGEVAGARDAVGGGEEEGGVVVGDFQV